MSSSGGGGKKPKPKYKFHYDPNINHHYPDNKPLPPLPVSSSSASAAPTSASVQIAHSGVQKRLSSVVEGEEESAAAWPLTGEAEEVLKEREISEGRAERRTDMGPSSGAGEGLEGRNWFHGWSLFWISF